MGLVNFTWKINGYSHLGETSSSSLTCKMFSKHESPLLVYLLPVFLSVVTGTQLLHSADTSGVPPAHKLDACTVNPMLNFSGSTWIWMGEQNGADEDDLLAGVHPFCKAIPSSSTKCLVCTTIIISCNDSYSIFVNGREIGVGSRLYTSAVYTIGLEPKGHNIFVITMNNIVRATGLIATIHVDYGDGTTQMIVTDTTWKMIKAMPPGGWMSPSFNNSAWIAALSEGLTAGTPWKMPPLPPAMSMAGVSWIRTNETSAAGVDPLGHRPFQKTIVDNGYTLYVNGNNISNGSDFATMQVYSIPILDADENLITVDSVNTQPIVAGLLAGVLVAYSDGTLVTYYTDNSWKTLVKTSPAGFEAMDLDDGL
ncbi:hypothetical protein EDD18DRAFT_1140612 [Armillaria luteobubalina]|uniref:Uncharacterized protein n=1 Tax=Armillaria luteobubalina TaxID=153913 RepID=A0AA39QGA4_9AGAR|nr:hypothetical protein EDD18DRAFT_1140612 [Armillaria luteobubalina]